jgi:hypothetical protein
MKKRLYYKKSIHFLFLFVVSIFLSYGQDYKKSEFSEEFTRNCILEVFQEHSDDLVFNSSSKRYHLLTDFMSRLEVIYQPSYKDKKIDSTNDLKLFTKYNPLLVNDKSYNKSTFNPLKYIAAINLNSKSEKVYRIASTDYLMVISPL